MDNRPATEIPDGAYGVIYRGEVYATDVPGAGRYAVIITVCKDKTWFRAYLYADTPDGDRSSASGDTFGEALYWIENRVWGFTRDGQPPF